MKIIVKAKPNAKENKVKKISENEFVVYVTASPVDGKANAVIVKLLASYFNTSQSMVSIASGYFTKTKVVEVHG